MTLRSNLLLRLLLALPLAACAGKGDGEHARAEATPNARPAAVAAYEAPRYTPAEVRAMMAEGRPITFVDVRSEQAYRIAHVKDALSLPWGELAKGHQQLPKERLLLLYCT